MGRRVSNKGTSLTTWCWEEARLGPIAWGRRQQGEWTVVGGSLASCSVPYTTQTTSGVHSDQSWLGKPHTE